MRARDTLAAYAERINRHDFDVLVDLIAPDAVFWFSDGSHQGLPAIRRAFEATWAALKDETYAISEIVWLNEEACAYRFARQAMIDGVPQSGSGRGTSVFRRVGERWQIVHEHLSAA